MELPRPELSNISVVQIILHVFCICALVISRPLFDLFAAHPEYFVVNRIQPLEVLLWVGLLSVLLPLMISLALVFLGLTKKKIQIWGYIIWVALLIGIFTLQLLKYSSIPNPYISIAIAVVIFTASLVILGYKPELLFGVTVLTPVIVIFPLLFIFNTSIQKILNTDVTTSQGMLETETVWIENKPPIFLVVFDEFSLVDLLDAEGGIDAHRFPNIAAYARNSSWYANASTVRHATTWAVPAILTGNWPENSSLPRFEDYPENLFSLLNGHYDFDVYETVTNLYNNKSNSEDLKESVSEGKDALIGFFEDTWVLYAHLIVPDGFIDYLPYVGAQWGGFLDSEVESVEIAGSLTESKNRPLDNTERAEAKNQLQELLKTTLKSDREDLFKTFINGFEGFPKNTLHFLHILLPHRPSIYLPSGKRTANTAKIIGVHEDKKTKAWTGEQTVVDKLHQRHLLQIGYVDMLWGRMIEKIKSMGLYDESLIILVADHGISFQANVSNRRPNIENFGEIAFVPLFIKYPYQEIPKRDETNVETIDILPTLVDVLGIKVAWEFDGRSLVDSNAEIQKNKKMLDAYGEVLEYSENQYLNLRQETLNRNIKAFKLDNPKASLFHYEDGLELVGRMLKELELMRLDCTVHSESLKSLLSLGNSSNVSPIRIMGELSCPSGTASNMLLILSSDGEVMSTTKPYLYDGKIYFDLVVSEENIFHSDDKIEVLVIDYNLN